MPQGRFRNWVSTYADRRVREEARTQGVPEDYAARQHKQETGGDPDVILGHKKSKAGAIGAMQLMPGTARDLGVDPYDVDQNIAGGVRYSKQMLDQFGGDKRLAAAAYNAGPGRVREAGGVPNIPETRHYADVVGGPAETAQPAGRFEQWKQKAEPRIEAWKSDTQRPSQQNPGAYGPDIPNEMLPQPSKRPAQPARPLGPRISAMPGADVRRPLTKQIQNLRTSPFETLQQGMAQREQSLPETPELQAKRKAAEEYAQKPVTSQIYEEAKRIPERLMTGLAQTGQRVETIGQGLVRGDVTPLTATGAQLAGGLVTGIQDVAGNVSNYLQEPGTTPNPAAREAIQQQLGRFSYANAEAVKANARKAYEESARKYLTDPNALNYDQLQQAAAQEAADAATRQTMAGNVTRAVGDALPAVALGAVGGLPAALGTQAAMGDIERPLDTAVNMASTAVPMALTRAARPMLNNATQAMRPIPRTLARTAGEMGVGAAGNVGQAAITEPLLTGKSLTAEKALESGAVGAAFGVSDAAQQGFADRAARRAQAPPQAKIATLETPPNLDATQPANVVAPPSSRIAGLRAAREASAADGQPASPTGRTGKQAPFVVLDQSEWNNDPTPGYRQSVVKVGDTEHLIEYDPKQINASAASAKAKHEIEQAAERRMRQPVARPVTSPQQTPTSADNAPVFEPRPAPPETGFETDISTRATDADAIINEFVQRGRLPQLTEIRDRLGITRTEAQGIQAEIADRQRAARPPRGQRPPQQPIIERQPLGQENPAAAKTQTTPGEEAPQQSVNAISDQINKPRQANDLTPNEPSTSKLPAIETPQQRRRGVPPAQPMRPNMRPAAVERMPRRQYAEYEGGEVRDYYQPPAVGEYGAKPAPPAQQPADVLPFRRRPPAPEAPRRPLRTPGPSDRSAVFPREQRDFMRQGRAIEEARATGTEGQGRFGRFAQQAFKSTVPDGEKGQTSFYESPNVKGAVGLDADASAGEVRQAFKKTFARMMKVNADEVSLTQVPQWAWDAWMRRNAPRLGAEDKRRYQQTIQNAQNIETAKAINENIQASDTQESGSRAGSVQPNETANRSRNSVVTDRANASDEQVGERRSLFESNAGRGDRSGDSGNANTARTPRTDDTAPQRSARILPNAATGVAERGISPRTAQMGDNPGAVPTNRATTVQLQLKGSERNQVPNADADFIHSLINDTGISRANLIKESGLTRGRLNPALEQLKQQGRIVEEGNVLRRAGEVRAAEAQPAVKTEERIWTTSRPRREASDFGMGSISGLQSSRMSERANARHLAAFDRDLDRPSAAKGWGDKVIEAYETGAFKIDDAGVSDDVRQLIRRHEAAKVEEKREAVIKQFDQWNSDFPSFKPGDTVSLGGTKMQVVKINGERIQVQSDGRKFTTDTDGLRRMTQNDANKVRQALREEKPVPPEVLADYPELAAKFGKPEAEAPRTITHDNPAINGKPIIATTAEGKSVVANPENKSGVSVVKDQGMSKASEPTLTEFVKQADRSDMAGPRRFYDGQQRVRRASTDELLDYLEKQEQFSVDDRFARQEMVEEAAVELGRRKVDRAEIARHVSEQQYVDFATSESRNQNVQDYNQSVNRASGARRGEVAGRIDRAAKRDYDERAKSARAEYRQLTSESSQSSPSEANQPAQPKGEGSVASAPRVNPAQTHIEKHLDLFDRIEKGQSSAAEIKASFEALAANKEAVTAELSKLTKEGIFEKFPGLRWRYKNEAKAEIVDAAFRGMQSDYTLNQSFSYGMGDNSYTKGIRAVVEKHTDESLGKYAENVKQAAAEREQKKKAALEGMAEPKTLEDFTRVIRAKAAEIGDGATFQQVRMSLTPEQRAQYDELAAAKSRDERRARADQQRTDVRAASQSMTGNVIETKHTKTGEPLFVVKAAERVERDVYNQWNATAKRLGGWYSSFRGAGAVPGFQFKTRANADAFLEYLGGKVDKAKEVAETRRDAMQDDKSQTAVERLREMADALDERANESLSVERKANTERRARFAASAESAANASKAMAKTMRNIADAIETGKAKFLDRVRQKVQVETLQNFVHSGQGDYLRSKYPTYAEQEKHFGESPTKEAADHASFPTYTAYRSDLAKLGRQLIEQEGTKKLGAAILKEADDVTDAYLKFAKENLHKVSTFGRQDGGKAVFPNKAAAEAAIVRSGYKGQAIVLPFKRGENVIILSPSAAREKGIWAGDNDKRITLGNDVGDELVAKLKTLKRREIDVPWTFESAYEKRKRLAGMGIETPAELRAALREFIGLREQAKAPDKIKEMERAMIGRKNDGLDFFPTPASVADRMVEVADVKEGMTVLEPSAGMGHVADRLREAGVEPDVVEMASDRRDLLKAKGYNLAGSDFMDTQGQYDRIVMNPPFSNRRDIEHVRHAYDLLKPEGRLVAIVGEGSFFGSDKKATEFREWLESVGGTSEKLEEGSFLDPSLPVNTGTNARMVVIDKSADAPQSQPQPVAEQAAPPVKTIDAKPTQAQNVVQDESGTLTIPKASAAQRGREGASVSQSPAPVVRAAQGSETAVSIPRQRGKLPARYEVRELGDLIPSHNPFSFEPNPDYKLTNDRDYRNPANRLDVEGATKQGAFEPDIVLSDDPTATNGPPIIDGSNQVLGGNSRTMMIARTYRNNPTDAQAYRARLKAKAAQYGFDAKAVDGFDQPVLVRVVDTAAQDTQKLVTAFNVQPGKAMSTAERAAAQSRNLKPETADYLARRIDLEGESGTLLKALEGEKGIAVLNRLIQDGAIPEGDRNAMVDRGKLSESAKLQIRKLFTGRMYRDVRQMESAPPLVANKLERVAPHVARLSGSDWDIAQHIPRAIDAIKEANSKNLNLDELNKQGAGLFGEAEPYSNEALAIARILQDFGVRQVEGKFRNYANAKADADKGGGMFGDVESQTEAFNRIFEASTPTLRYSGAAPHDLIKAIKDSELSKAIKEAWEEGKRLKAEEGRVAALKHGGLEAANAVRGLNLAGDLLALRQGARVSLSPRYWKQAGKDFGRALGAFKAKNYDAILTDIANRSYTFDGEKVNLLEVLHDTAKVEFTGQHLRDLLKGGKAREEGYESRIVASLPVARNIEQVNASFMDLRRIDLGMRYLDAIQADKSIQTAEQLNQALQEMGRAINILSGRGQRVMVKTKPGEAPKQAARLSNALLGSGPVLLNSPKYLTSHIQAFNESFNPLSRQITGTVRKEMLKDMMGWAGTLTAGLALAAAAGAEVGLDPDNADFGKIKIGNRRYDIGGAGSLTLLRLYWKMGKAAVDSSAKNGKEAWDALARFTRGKLAPVPGFIATAKAPLFDPYAKKPFTEMSGEVVTPGRAALNRVLPIGAQEFYKAYEEDQMKGVLLTLPTELGAGVQNYASKRPSRYVLRRDPGETLPSIKRGLRDTPKARRPAMPRAGQ